MTVRLAGLVAGSVGLRQVRLRLCCETAAVLDAAPGRMVVVAGLLRRGGRALVVHRSPHRRWFPDAWDLPGGHVAEGEEPRAALVRELHEELGIVVDVVGEPFVQVHAADFRLDIWLIDCWVGAPINAAPDEHDALAWVTASELDSLRLVDDRLPQLIDQALRHTR